MDVTVITARILSQSPYFRGIPKEILDGICTFGQPVSLPKGEVLALEGAGANACWVMGRGAVEVRKTLDQRERGKEREPLEHRLATLGPGAFFGQVALLDGKARSSKLVVTENAELVEFNQRDFERLRLDRSAVGRYFRRAYILALADVLNQSVEHLQQILGSSR